MSTWTSSHVGSLFTSREGLLSMDMLDEENFINTKTHFTIKVCNIALGLSIELIV